MPTVTCAYCGKELHRTPRQVRECKTGLFFCNSQERRAYWKEHGMSSQEQIGKHGYSRGGTRLAVREGEA